MNAACLTMGWCVILIVADMAMSPEAAAFPQSSSLADLSLEELSNLEITSASKRPERWAEAATSVYVITADDIRRSGAVNLPDALRLAPNLQVAQISASGYSISARGFSGTSANKLLVMIDGRSVYTPLFAGVFWDVQDVMLSDVDRIEVISGPGGTLWGVNAVNGVINVITRAASQTQKTLVAADAGNSGGDVAVRYGGALGEDGHYRVYAKHFNRNHTETATGADIHDATQSSQAGFRADWQRAADQITVQGNIYSGDRDQPAPGSISITGVRIPLGPISTDGLNMVGGWVRRLEEGATVSAQAYYDHTRRTVVPTFAEDLDIFDAQLQYSAAPHGAHAVTLGAEYRYSMDHLVNSRYFGFLPDDVDQSWSSLFAQDDVTLSKDLKLTLGLRAEHNDYTGAEYLPNVRLAWKPAADQLIWSAVSRTVRAPARLDRDAYVPWPSNFGPGPAYLLAGGPNVQSEIAEVYELGYRGRPTDHTSYSITAYRARYDRLHTQELAPSRTYVVYAGKLQADVNGVEMWGSYQPLDWWRLSAGFTGMRQKFWLQPGSTDRSGLLAAQGRDPAQTWMLRSAFDLPRQTEFDLAVRHVSALRNPDVPDYLAIDMRLGWRPRADFEVSAAGQNLFGTAHGEYTSVTTRSELGPSVYVELLSRF